MRWAQNRSPGPHTEPLKDHSWSWLKARHRGRGEGPDDERYRHHHLLPVKQFVIELSL